MSLCCSVLSFGVTLGRGLAGGGAYKINNHIMSSKQNTKTSLLQTSHIIHVHVHVQLYMYMYNYTCTTVHTNTTNTIMKLLY